MYPTTYPLTTSLLIISGCTGGAFNSQNNASNPAQPTTITQVANQPFSYDDYGTVLETYVNNQGQVNYEALKANRQPLDAFNSSLATLSPETFNNWSDPEKIAFWVNIYNSLTLQAIIDHYPTKSIRDIPGVWKQLKFNVMGEELTLDQIEHEILRKEFNEPRIHMGLVCASVGCPVLRQEPFFGEQLDQQLNEQTQQFLALNQNFQINPDANIVKLSSIFKWFGEDFEPTYKVDNKFAGNNKERAVLNFVSQYLDENQQAYLAQGKYKVDYLDYDWSLNQQ
ncbi:MAG: DUF547 domain-containing protein [Oscillatoriales cyanobacterium RM1_1_9]|nr:DUF547 domain-containing protein [Oscillatoriales cyanobacterium RM1_1_9]